MCAAFLSETTVASRPRNPWARSVATAAEAMNKYLQNKARTWFRDNVEADTRDGKYALERLRETWFTPQIGPKFKLRRDDKFYAIGSCFSRGLDSSLLGHNITVES